jgi:hypothetical protein
MARLLSGLFAAPELRQLSHSLQQQSSDRLLLPVRHGKTGLTRRDSLSLLSAAMVCMPARLSASGKPAYITPEQFGAVGDGVTNDTAAFVKMSAFVTHHGGTIALRPTTYIVGSQGYDPKHKDYSFWPSPIMDFDGCSRPISILGNGAVLRCADGLRFGTFTRDGQPTSHPMPYYGIGEIAGPYYSMIHVANCSGPVQITDLELDGNVGGLRIGGPWGDVGWQIGCAGLRLDNNTGPVIISQVNSHHHAQDGGSGNGGAVAGVLEPVSIQDCEFASNARNAWSMVGGVGWQFARCKFNGSARGLPIASPPMCGIDFEAEGGRYVSKITLSDCVAEDNTRVGYAFGDRTNVSDISWTGGRIVGNVGTAFYGAGVDGVTFQNTTFLGMLVNLDSETFQNCRFSDNPSESGYPTLFNPNGFIIPDCVATNSFIECEIVHATSVYSPNGNYNASLFDNCCFRSKAGAGRLDVMGHFRGKNTLFIAESGGTNFAVTPGAEGGGKSAGAAEDSFTVTTSAGVSTVYPPVAA